MHPYAIEQIADMRMSELQREAAQWRLRRELRTSARSAGCDRRGWARRLRLAVRSRLAAA